MNKRTPHQIYNMKNATHTPSHPEHTQHLLKIILLGDAGVGKTALFSTYLHLDPPTPDYITTIGVDFGHRMLRTKDNYPLKLQLWDTAGQERFRSITRSYYRGAHIIFLLFDITHRPSFESLTSWVSDVGSTVSNKDTKTPRPRYFVVATKADQADEKRAVTTEEARLFAATLDAPYFEVSTTDPTSIETLFEAIVPVVQTTPQLGDVRKTLTIRKSSGQEYLSETKERYGSIRCC